MEFKKIDDRLTVIGNRPRTEITDPKADYCNWD